MPAERIIAIDFGTSTSVVRVKRYQDEQPLGERMETKPVTFNVGSTVVPTIIQKQETTQESRYFGYEAESSRRNHETCRNFKIQIEDPDPEVRERARSLTAEFFSYLFRTYQEQSRGGHLGEGDDRERTIISYPVKWNSDTRAFMLETARKAGFPNVEGRDEAQAAIQAVTVQSEQLLRDQGYFVSGESVNILLIDMGAGTTDLVLCRHTPGDTAQTEILATWPHGGFVLFGGSGVDELLRCYIKSRIPADSTEKVLKKFGTDKFKAWKEHVVSPALARGETVDYFSALDELLDAMEIDIDYSIDRQIFEDFGQGYLQGLPELVNGCLHKAGMDGDSVDLVILTGGHSQWYFVREILSGKLGRFGGVGLGKIQADPKRIISVALPQESVALGLSYSPLRAALSKPTPKQKVKPEPNPVKKAGAATSNPKPHTSPSVRLERPARLSRPERPMRPSLPGKDAGMDEIREFYRKTQWADYMITNIRGSDYYLRYDGRVVDEYGKECYNNWNNIVSILCGVNEIVGLRSDGTVVVKYYGYSYLDKIRDWNDIVSIASGLGYMVGLKTDGTVVAVSLKSFDIYYECNVGNWSNIVSIACGDHHTVGLRSDGTVVAVGDKGYGQCNVENWNDIVSIACGNRHTVGLRSDGTVVAIGDNRDGQCNVENWRDIVSIACTHNGGHTVGLRSNGTVVATGINRLGQCNVQKWNNVLSIASSSGRTSAVLNDGHVIQTSYLEKEISQIFGLKKSSVRSPGPTKTLPFKLF